VTSVPIIGQLFSSRSYIKNETDLAIIVTPRLVKPARPGDPIQTPLDNTVPANDPEFFLLGKAERSKAGAAASAGNIMPYSGHILDLSKGGANVVAVRN
jgi:pilus assembly protein CpaC